MKKKIGVLFDLDGVLVDSEGEYSKFWGGMGRRYGVGGESFAADIKGTTLGEILNAFPENVRDGIVMELHQFERSMTYPMFNGVYEFLCKLRDNCIPFAIVTSSDDVKMEYLFNARPEIRGMVSALVTGSMVNRSKPNPEGYLKGAELIGVPIEDCYVFEDSMQGLEAGMRSGAVVIALTTTNPCEKLKGKAHEIIDGFAGFTVDMLVGLSRPI